MSLYEDFSKGTPETSNIKPFTANRRWLHKFKDRFGLNNIMITEEAMFPD